MNKVIHAAVRRDLRRLEDALNGVSEGDQQRAHDLARAWKHLADQLHHHHTQEDDLLFPAAVHLLGDRALVESLEAEHEGMVAALAEIDGAMSAYAVSGSLLDAREAAERVRAGAEVVDRHFAHEEADFEPLVQPYAQSPEWLAAMKQVRRLSPRAAGWFLAWLEDGADADARAQLAADVPGPVRLVFGRAFGRGYHRSIARVWG